MTEQEAIEKIRTQICNEKGVQRYCRDNCMHGVEQCAYSMAIKALEKQIAKKPTNIHKLLDTIGFCPNCKLRIYRMYAEEHYCHHCGQKLDWE